MILWLKDDEREVIVAVTADPGLTEVAERDSVDLRGIVLHTKVPLTEPPVMLVLPIEKLAPMLTDNVPSLEWVTFPVHEARRQFTLFLVSISRFLLSFFTPETEISTEFSFSFRLYAEPL